MNYSEITLKYFENPINVGRLKKENVKHVLYGSPDIHFLVSFDFEIENSIVRDAKFLAYGGVKVIAGAAFIVETIKGMSLNEVKSSIDVSFLMERLLWSSEDIPIAMMLITTMSQNI